MGLLTEAETKGFWDRKWKEAEAAPIIMAGGYVSGSPLFDGTAGQQATPAAAAAPAAKLAALVAAPTPARKADRPAFDREKFDRAFLERAETIVHRIYGVPGTVAQAKLAAPVATGVTQLTEHNARELVTLGKVTESATEYTRRLKVAHKGTRSDNASFAKACAAEIQATIPRVRSFVDSVLGFAESLKLADAPEICEAVGPLDNLIRRLENATA